MAGEHLLPGSSDMPQDPYPTQRLDDGSREELRAQIARELEGTGLDAEEVSERAVQVIELARSGALGNDEVVLIKKPNNVNEGE